MPTQAVRVDLPSGTFPQSLVENLETDLAAKVALTDIDSKAKLEAIVGEPIGGGGTPDPGSITNTEIAAGAGIEQSKIANLTADLAAKETPAGAQAKADAAQAAAATDATTKANAAQAAAEATASADATTKANAAQAFAIQRANHTGTQAISTVTGLQTALDAKETPAGAQAKADAAEAAAIAAAATDATTKANAAQAAAEATAAADATTKANAAKVRSAHVGSSVIVEAVVSGTEIDVDEPLSSKSISADTTFTFSATTTGVEFRFIARNTDVLDHTITMPSAYSEAQGANVTEYVVPAGESLMLGFRREASQWAVYGDPVSDAPPEMSDAEVTTGTDTTPKTPTAAQLKLAAETHGGSGTPDDGSVTNVKVAADADIAQSKIANLTTDLAAKAPLASPALTGTPTAPTAATSTDTTQIATTAFVQQEIAASGSGGWATGDLRTIPDAFSVPSGFSLTGVNGIPAYTSPDADWKGVVKVGGTVADVTFDPVAGAVADNSDVTLATATPSASIRYTTNGDTPTRDTGTVYSGPITITDPVTIKAIAYLNYWIDSDVTEAAYTIASSGITFFDKAENNHGTTRSPTVNYPASIAENDIMLVAFVTDTVHSTGGTAPSGWNKITQRDGGTNTTVSVFWKRAGAGQGTSETWTDIYDSNELGTAVCVVYRGCITTGDPQDATFTSGSKTGTAFDQSITTVTDGAMVVAFVGTDPAFGVSFVWDSPINERVDFINGTTSYMTVGDIIKATAGSQNMGGDLSGSSDSGMVVVALKPA